MTVEPSHRMNILVVGCAYFMLFSLSVWAHFERTLFVFPASGENFARSILLDIGIGVAAALPIVAATGLASRLIPSMRSLVGDFASLIGPLEGREIFFLSIFSALGEEFFFRGLIQGKFGFWVASLAFGLLHVGPTRRFLPWTLFATAIGFFLGWLYIWRQDLLTPVVTHFLVNLINLRLLRRQGPGNS